MRTRNQYLDLLRAVATVRVVVYHSTGWAALSIVFPAMSVMFALGGSLMAASLDRYGPWAVEKRLHRLLPSVWVLVAIAVLVEEMIVEGGLTKIYADLYVERDSQKSIVIGARGARLKEVGSQARREIEQLLGGKVYLDLHVRVAKEWQRDPRQLRKLGF